jgi:hypothetical protein
MTARPLRRRARRRLLVRSTAVVLGGATLILTVLSIVGYVRYQQLAAKARTASDAAREIEQSTQYTGGLTDDNFPLKILCSGDYIYNPEEDGAILLIPTGSSRGPRCSHIDIRTGAVAGSNTLNTEPMLLCTWNSVDTPHTDACAPMTSFTVSLHPFHYHLLFVDTLGQQVQANFAVLTSSRGNEVIAITHGQVDDFDRVQYIGILDESNKVVMSFQPSDTITAFLFMARQASDSAHAAEEAMQKLVTTGASLACLAASALAWIATRRHVRPRRALLQRQGTTTSGIWQPSSEKAWTGRMTIGLIASAVRALGHPDDQARYREEWAADAEEIQGRWQRLRWALLLRLFAPKGIRSARRDELSMSPPQQR